MYCSGFNNLLYNNEQELCIGYFVPGYFFKGSIMEYQPGRSALLK